MLKIKILLIYEVSILKACDNEFQGQIRAPKLNEL